jgi:dihydropteroate synthase
MINEFRAMTSRGALNAAAALNVPVCLMHMQGEPRTMQVIGDNGKMDGAQKGVRADDDAR